jgi:Flp pilus assembly protein TadG
MVLGLLMVAGLVLDGGLALAGKVQAIDEAQEAARAGAQQLDLTTYRDSGQVVLAPNQAVAAARTYLTATGNTDAASATVTVTGDRVAVTVTRHQPTQLLGLLGLGSLTVTGHGEAVAAHGVNGPQP